MEVRCLGCAQVMFQAKALDDKGNVGIERSARDLFQSDGVDEYFLCPHCNAKNVVISTQSKSGLPGIKISHTKI